MAGSAATPQLPQLPQQPDQIKHVVDNALSVLLHCMLQDNNWITSASHNEIIHNHFSLGSCNAGVRAWLTALFQESGVPSTCAEGTSLFGQGL